MKKFTALFSLLLVCVVLPLSGCGGSNVTGTLTMTQPTVDSSSATFSRVTTTITYTNPNVTSVGNVVVTVNGTEHVLPDNGTNTASFNMTFLANRDPAVDTIYRITATTGDLEASVSATIPKQTTASTALTANPTTVTFLSTDLLNSTKTVTISGGTTPYLQPFVSPTSPNNIVTASITGSTLTITRTTAGTGSGSVIVIDSANPAGSVVIPVTLQ